MRSRRYGRAVTTLTPTATRAARLARHLVAWKNTPTHPHRGARVSSGGYRPRECPVRSRLHLFRGFRGPEWRSCCRTPHRADDPAPPAAFAGLAQQLPSAVPVPLAAAVGALAQQFPLVVPVHLAVAASRLLYRSRVQTGARTSPTMIARPPALLRIPGRRRA